ncbi:chloride channel protein [Streptococcus pluranimalium]|uniref:Voltage-gated chloride channel protein n=1 Tax=Streptococcus pluranimalium TaxID=82348 RepID=A0A2L0D2Z9_9STRE|nr:chloride channel protein [Streptococcus pluranimalium]AUW96176.1 voltage-gated chloride channel protein [Streptococcus pluranimalium]
MKSQDHFYRQLLSLEVAAVIIGLSAGALDALFGRVLLFVSDIRTQSPYWTIPFLGLAGLLIVFLYQRYGGESVKGMGLVFEVGQGQRQKIPKRLMPLVIVTTWLTHLFGGSAGREGVAVQLGATIGTNLTAFSFLKKYSKELLVIGMAAGFGGLFETPMAATFFALEVLVIGKLSLHLFLPAFTAAFIASQTSHFLGLEKFSHDISSNLQLDFLTVGKLLLAGFCFAFVGKLFALSLQFLKAKLTKMDPNPYVKMALGGLVLSLIFLSLASGRYSGLGTNLIDASFLGGYIYAYDWLLKLFLTVITISLGFQGGEVTPLFSIGASLGVVLSPFFGLPIDLLAALGYVAVFASATNTLFGPLLIMGEVFGFTNTPYAFIVLVMVSCLQFLPSIYQLQKHSIAEKPKI